MSQPEPLDNATLAATPQSIALHQTLATQAGDNPSVPRVPATIQLPGYEILEELGRGGMGVVYRARDLRLKRHVALKMILAGAHADREQHKRFRAEAEAVARLRHPGIVQIYEVGEQEGLPFFSLEFCAGGSLGVRLKENPLPPVEAAALVEQLAQAMQHAHSSGIIHRDLKPGNILLTGAKEESSGSQPTREERRENKSTFGGSERNSSVGQGSFALVPKVTDFGLAKQLDSEQGQTATGAVLGTPSYMAPEQAEGRNRDIGPAVDIYALGAILYECVTGRPPFRASTPLETIQQVLSQSPVAVRQLQPAVPKDLETICLKCLHKEPHRRYATAEDLVADLQRFLRREPVLARPIGNAERFARWCKKNPAIASVSAFAILLLVATLVSVTALYLRAEGLRQLAEANEERAESQRQKAEGERLRAEENAERAGKQQLLAEENATKASQERKRAEENADKALQQRQRAERESARAIAEANKAKSVTQFMIGLFEASDPFGLGGYSFYIPKAMGEKLTAREILQRGADKIAADKQTPPRTRAAILDTIGNVNRTLGNYTDADKQLTAALELRRQLDPPEPLEVAQTLFNKGWLAHERGQYVHAEIFYREALKLRLAHAPENDASIAGSQFNLAWLLMEMEEFGESETLLQEVVKRRLAIFGEDHREVALARFGLATLYLDSGEFAKAMPLSTGAFKVLQQEGNASLTRAAGQFQTAVFQSAILKNHTAAGKSLLESLKLMRETVGEDHVYNCFIHGQLAITYRALNRPEDAEKQWRAGIEIGKKHVGFAHPKMLIAVSHLAELLVERKKQAEAEALYQELLKAQKDRFGDKHPFVADALFEYAALLYSIKKFPERESVLKEAVAIYRLKPGTPRRQFPEALNFLAVVLSSKGKQAESEAMHREAVACEKKIHKPRFDNLALFQSNIAIARMNQNLFDEEVETVLRDCESTIARLNTGARKSRYYTLQMNWIRYHRQLGHHRESVDAATKAAEVWPTSSRHLYDSAAEIAGCLALLEKSGSEPESTKESLRAQYTGQSLKLLRQAVSNGWKSPSLLKTGSTWAPIRSNKEFQAILADIEKGGATPNPSPTP